MAEQSIAAVDEFLRQNERKDLLRFSTCGSIDDGKSTLIGRLLHDAKSVYEDQLDSARHASRERASRELIDFALLTDGLKAEREQGITIDVAYRYFSTPKRKFIIADTPGHEQYTRNMATGASTANLAVILIDARQGMLVQTRRHAFITSLLGVPHLVVAINKMDMVDYAEEVFDRIRRDFVEFAAKLRIPDLRFIPVSALHGENVVTRSDRMPWYRGESLLETLENVYIGSDRNLVDLRFPVQYVQRPDQNFRGYCGQIVSGVLRTGDEITVLPSMTLARVRSIVTWEGEIEAAFAPMSVTVTLDCERDISRGDMLVHRHNVPHVTRHFEAMLVWMGESAMDVNRPYLIKHTTQTVPLRVDEVRYRVDVNTLNRLPSAPLKLNEIGRVVFTVTRPLFTDPYDKNRATGSFIVIDPIGNHTVAAGMIIEREPEGQLPSRLAASGAATAGLVAQRSRVTPAHRVERMGQRPVTLWFTGLVGSGKTRLAYRLEERLFELGGTCLVLDGENMRLGVSRELDFSSAGRAEHLRRAAEVARLANDAGLMVICGFVSPTAAVRAQVATIVGAERFLEVHVNSPLEWCEQHDASGLYARARRGEVQHLAGVSLPYEAPAAPALSIPMHEIDEDEGARRILAFLRDRGFFPAH